VTAKDCLDARCHGRSVAVESPSVDPADRSLTPLLNALCLATSRLDGLDTSQSEGPDDLVHARLTELGSLLRNVVQQLQTMEKLSNGEVTDFFPEPPSGLFSTEPLSGTTPASRLGDLCFAGVLDLSQAVRRLEQARSFEELLTAAEAALRKLRRCVQAVLAAVQEAGLFAVFDGLPLRPEPEDLTSTLAVRRLYAEFRRSLRQPEGATAAEVFVALRYAAGALAVLTASPHYYHARVSDRSLLRALHRRVLAWARTDRSTEAGLQLLNDTRTCADLLRGINCRQEIRAHDRALIEQLSAGPTGGDGEEWSQRLDLLFGLDDRLDALIDAARAGTTSELTQDVLALLAQLP
jgi:hypothetical protein